MPVLDATDEATIRTIVDAALVAAVNLSANVVQCGGSAVAAGAIPNFAAGASGGILINGGNANGATLTLPPVDIAGGALKLGDGFHTVDAVAGVLSSLRLAGGVVVGPSSGNIGVRIDGAVAAVLLTDGSGGAGAFACEPSQAFLAAFFTANSGETYATSAAGSVVQEIADNAVGGGGGGGGLTLADFFADSTLTFADADPASIIAIIANNANVQQWKDDVPQDLNFAGFVQVDSVYVAGSFSWRDGFNKYFSSLASFAVDNSAISPTPTLFDTNCTTNLDVFSGRQLRFLGGTVANGMTRVVGYAFVGGRVRLTVSPALPTSPAGGDAFLLCELEAGAVDSVKAGVITDAAFTVPTLTAPATGILGFITALWRNFYKPRKNDKVAGEIINYADDGTTPIATSSYTSTTGADRIDGAV